LIHTVLVIFQTLFGLNLYWFNVMMTRLDDVVFFFAILFMFACVYVKYYGYSLF
jgi:hypothetical protein